MVGIIMDILRTFCESVPDGETGEQLATNLASGYLMKFEERLFNLDFVQNKERPVYERRQELPTTIIHEDGDYNYSAGAPYVHTIYKIVNGLEPFSDAKSMLKTKNKKGEEYSALVRNLFTPSGECSDNTRKFCESMDKLWEDVKSTYPRYYDVMRSGFVYKSYRLKCAYPGAVDN